MSFKQLTSSKMSLGVLVALLVMFGNLKYRQWQDQKAIEAEKQNLFRQEQALEQRKQDINNSLAFINSPDFKEKIAREQLGLKKEGEVVYSFSEGEGQAPVAAEPKTPDTSNTRKWWNYFFNNKLD